MNNVGRTIMIEHRYKSNDYPGAFGGFEWSGDVTDLLHTPGWFADYVEELFLEFKCNLFEKMTPEGEYRQDALYILHFITNDGGCLTAEPGDIVLFRHGKIVVCTPDICKFFLKELM